MSPKLKSAGQTWVIIGVAILAVIAIGLSALAILSTRGSGQPAGDYSYTQDSDSGEQTEEEAPEEEAEPEPEPEISLNAHTRFISLGADDQVIRGEFGSCTGEPGWAEVSPDGGIFWELSNTVVHEAMQILGVSIGTGGYVEMTTLDTFCEPFLLRSYIGGYNWQFAPGEVESRWYFNPLNAATVNTPFGQAEAPCEVIQLSVSESATNAAVLCEDSTIMSSTDEGQSWSVAGERTGAVAVAAQDDRLLIANGHSEGCNGVQLQTISGGVTENVGSCLDVSTTSDQIAFAAFAGDVAIWSGDALRWSIDGGESWL